MSNNSDLIDKMKVLNKIKENFTNNNSKYSSVIEKILQESDTTSSDSSGSNNNNNNDNNNNNNSQIDKYELYNKFSELKNKVVMEDDDNVGEANAMFLIGNTGVDNSVVQLLPPSVIQKYKVKSCNICGKYYMQYMWTKYEDIYVCCWHCLFCMNYDKKQRKKVDGVYGKKISEYIAEFGPSHKPTICERIGCCFLCDYKKQKKKTNISNIKEIKIKQKIDLADDEIFNERSPYSFEIDI
jgi:copper chaperone CopZ